MYRSVALAFLSAIMAAIVGFRSESIVLLLLVFFGLFEVVRLSKKLDKLQLKLSELSRQAISESGNASDAVSDELGSGVEVVPPAWLPPQDASVSTKVTSPAESLQDRVNSLLDGAVVPATPTERDVTLQLQRSQEQKNGQNNEQEAAEQVAGGGFASSTLGAIRRRMEATSLATRVGSIVLFFGIGFLLKYAADSGFFPIQVRLLCVIVLGVGMYLLGRRAQHTQREFGLLLKGCAVGIWYLSTYAASSIYLLIGLNLSFVVLALLSAFTAWHAMRHDAKALALIGVVGGFLTPILLSSGGGNHVLLFSYYALINAGIIAIAYQKTWLELPLVGFVFTFGVGTLWGHNSYQPEFFATTEPFLLLSALFYLAVPLLFANQAKWGRQPVYNGILVFAMPALTLALQLRLVSDTQHGDTISAFAFAAVYGAVLYILWRHLREHAPLLRDSFIGIGAVFFTLGIAFALDAGVASACWALEALGGVWLALRQRRLWGCYLSLLVLIGAGLLWLSQMPEPGERLLLNSGYLQIVIVALSSLTIVYLLDRNSDWIGVSLPRLVAVWVALWWVGGGLWQFFEHLSQEQALLGMALYALATTTGLLALYSRFRWLRAGVCAGYSLYAIAGLGVLAGVAVESLMTLLAALFFGLGTAGMYLCALYILPVGPLQRFTRVAYSAAIVLILAFGVPEFYAFINASHESDSAKLIGLITVPLLVFWYVQWGRLWRSEYIRFHRQDIGGVLALLLSIFFLFGLAVAPDLQLNTAAAVAWPINLLQIGMLASVALWWQQNGSVSIAGIDRERGWLIILVASFALTNVLILRYVHVHHGVPYDAGPLFNNAMVQTTFSILWATTGVVAVMTGSRRNRLLAWNLGMGLLGVVVVKLFLIDLAQIGTLERIVSFIAVGLLLMLVGWKSPRPVALDQDLESDALDTVNERTT